MKSSLGQPACFLQKHLDYIIVVGKITKCQERWRGAPAISPCALVGWARLVPIQVCCFVCVVSLSVLLFSLCLNKYLLESIVFCMMIEAKMMAPEALTLFPISSLVFVVGASYSVLRWCCDLTFQRDYVHYVGQCGKASMRTYE